MYCVVGSVEAKDHSDIASRAQRSTSVRGW